MNTASDPHFFDVQVGARVRSRRKDIGLSQSDLARQIGLTFQQVQKYESGANRISASKLYLIAGVLEVPIASLMGEGESASTDAPPLDRDTTRLLAGWRAIRSPEQRRHLLGLIEALGARKADDPTT